MSAGSQTTVAQPSLATCLAIGAFWSIVGAVLARGLTLSASIVAARLLGTAGFGEVSMIQSTQGLFGVLAGGGLGLAATKFVAEHRSNDPAKASRCIALALMLALASGLLGAAVLMLFSSQLASNVLKAPHLVGELQVATGLLLFGAINGVQTGALAGLGDFRMMAVVGILRGACLFAALLIGIKFGGVMGGVIGLVVTEAFAVVANHLALHRLFPQRLPRSLDGMFQWNEMRAMIHFSGLAILASLATTAALWFSNVVLATQPNGYAALGVFNAAERWRQVLLFLPAAVAPILLSMLSSLHGKNDPTAYRQLIRLNLWVSLVAVALPTAGLMLLAPLAMGLAGAEYQEGSLTLVILAGSAIAVVMNNILGQVLVSQGAMWWRFGIDLLFAGVLALVSWLVIPAWHDRGLAFGNLLAYAAMAIALIPLVFWYLKKTPSVPVARVVA